jgi:hypothetical protein
VATKNKGGHDLTEFAARVQAAYATDGAAVTLGRAMLEGTVASAAVVQIPLAMTNRHGLIAGATGTGKTVTVQVLAEQLADAGVAVDVKVECAPRRTRRTRSSRRTSARDDDSIVEDVLGSREGRSIVNTILRGIFGILKRADAAPAQDLNRYSTASPSRSSTSSRSCA